VEIAGLKVGSFVLAFYLVMRNRVVRRWLIKVFERCVLTEKLN